LARKQVDRDTRIVVIGLGRFGQNVARTLHEIGYEVTAIDPDERAVDEAAEYTQLVVQGDGTDEELLRSLEIQQCAVGIVAQGRNLEASLLSTLQLKRIGVDYVVARATTELHRELLARIGADQVVFPERDQGIRLAHALSVPNLNDYLSLSPTSGIGKFHAPASFFGRSIGDIHELADSSVSVLLVKRGDLIVASPDHREVIQRGDEIVIAGPDADIEAFVEAEIDGSAA
jgi:trk system potassium uptake protein TrkA